MNALDCGLSGVTLLLKLVVMRGDVPVRSLRVSLNKAIALCRLGLWCVAQCGFDCGAGLVGGFKALLGVALAGAVKVLGGCPRIVARVFLHQRHVRRYLGVVAHGVPPSPLVRSAIASA